MIVFAMTFGLTARIVAAAVFVAAYTAIQAAFGRRIRERFERQPDLRLAVADEDTFVNVVESSILPPWPFDANRVVAKELERLSEEAAVIEKAVRKGPAAMLLRATDPFASRPRDQDYQQAREHFTEMLCEYEEALRTWLNEYGEAAEARAHTFELRLSIISARSGAYAEDVVLTVDLPEGVKSVDEWPTVLPPPEPPAYVAPRPRSALEIARPSYPRLDLGFPRPDFSTIATPSVSSWETSSDGAAHLKASGQHPSRLDNRPKERVLLQAPTDGCHRLTWTLRTKNGRRHRGGALDLIVSPAERTRHSHGCTASRATPTHRSLMTMATS